MGNEGPVLVGLLIHDREWRQEEGAKGERSRGNDTEDLTHHLEIG